MRATDARWGVVRVGVLFCMTEGSGPFTVRARASVFPIKGVGIEIKKHQKTLSYTRIR